MKTSAHTRLSREESAILEELKKSTGQSESDLLQLGLRLVFKEALPVRSAREVAGKSAGKLRKGPKDLSANRKHLEGFGE